MTDENITGEKDKHQPGKLKKSVDAITGVNDLPQGRAKRTIYYLTGVSDIYFIIASVKQTFGLLFQRASFVKEQFKNLEAPADGSGSNKNFEEVVKNSKLSIDENIIKAGKYKKYWLCCFFIALLMSLFMIAGCVKMLVNAEYSMVFLKVTLTLGMMFSVGIFSFIKALTYEFLGWQLRNRIHSEAERGTLRFFMSDSGVKNTFNFEQAGQLRGDHE